LQDTLSGVVPLLVKSFTTFFGKNMPIYLPCTAAQTAIANTKNALCCDVLYVPSPGPLCCSGQCGVRVDAMCMSEALVCVVHVCACARASWWSLHVVSAHDAAP
jgi:hypothetical protein